MSSRIVKYNRYGNTLRRFLLFAGLWPVVNASVFYRIVPYLHLSAEIWTLCAVLNFCRQHVKNFRLLVKGLGLALSFLTTLQKVNEILKKKKFFFCVVMAHNCFHCKSSLCIWLLTVWQMFCLLLYRDRLIELHTNLEETFSQDLEDAELRPILLSPLLTYYRPSLVLSVGAISLLVMYWIAPILLIIIQLAHGASVIKYILPFTTIYPWSIGPTNAWLYSGLYIFEIYAGTFVGCIAASVDSLFGYYIFQISGQLRTLSYRLNNMKASENYRKVIKECVSRQQILTRCQVHLERIYGPIVLWLSVTNAMIMCAMIWQATHVCIIISFFVSILLQVFINPRNLLPRQTQKKLWSLGYLLSWRPFKHFSMGGSARR